MNINRETLNSYWQQVRKYKLSFFAALISIPMAELLISTLLPYFLSLAIGGLTESNNTTVRHHLLLASVFGISGAVLNFIGFQSLTRRESSVRKALTDTSFASLIRKDVGFLHQYKSRRTHNSSYRFHTQPRYTTRFTDHPYSVLFCP